MVRLAAHFLTIWNVQKKDIVVGGSTAVDGE